MMKEVSELLGATSGATPNKVRELHGAPHFTDEERAAVAQLLRQHIAADRFPLAPRMRPLKSALAKLDPPMAPASAPLPRPKAWVNSTVGRRKRR